MNLCIVSSGDFFSDYGGGQVYVRNIVDAFIEKKQAWDIQLSVISFHRKFPTTAKSKDYSGIPIYEINPEGDIEALLSNINPNLVHANGEKLKVAKACQRLGIPCVVTAHHGGIVCPSGALLNTKDEICTIPADYKHCLHCYLRNTPTGLWWYPFLKRFKQEKLVKFGYRLKKLPFIPFLTSILETGLIVSNKLKDWQELSETTTHFIAPSNAIADALIRNGCQSSKVTVVPHGIPIPFKGNSQFTIHNLQFTIFYYVGRINYVKGIHILLKAFSSIENPNIRLHLIGGAGNKTELRYKKKLQCKYHKDKRVIWHGKLSYDKMNEMVEDYQCLVHPAIYLEVFGLNISEALAQHKYVIATRCGGPEMQINNDSEGLIVVPNDVNALKGAMLHYIANPKQTVAHVIDIVEHIYSLYNLFVKLKVSQ